MSSEGEHMLKRILAVLASLLVATTATIALTAAPASAAPTCPDGYICWYDLSNWQGPSYVADPWGLPAHTCFNMSYDPNTGVNWSTIIDSVWWNANSSFNAGDYAEFYSGVNCTVAAVTRSTPYGPTYNAMQSCNEGPAPDPWVGPCGGSGPQRIRSWAFHIA